jgi:hypothetical protein
MKLATAYAVESQIP